MIEAYEVKVGVEVTEAYEVEVGVEVQGAVPSQWEVHEEQMQCVEDHGLVEHASYDPVLALCSEVEGSAEKTCRRASPVLKARLGQTPMLARPLDVRNALERSETIRKCFKVSVTDDQLAGLLILLSCGECMKGDDSLGSK